MEKEVQQNIERSPQNHNQGIDIQDRLEAFDQFDPLKSSQLKKSHFSQLKQMQAAQEDNQKASYLEDNRRLLKNLPYSDRVSLHEQYPALSKELQEEEASNNSNQLQIQQHEETQFKQSKHINEENQFHQDNHTQNKTSTLLQKQKRPTLPSQEKFQKFLNHQIGQMLINNMNESRKISQALPSPILLPRSYSQKSGDTSFYDPQRYSLNLSRSYIPNFLSLGNPIVYEFTPTESKQTIQKKLKQIFEYYAETYLQPTKYYDTFDSVKKRTMGFQSFCLFAKDFKILKTIFSLQTIKKVFKKQSEFGKVLELKHFIKIIEALSHQKQCNIYFKLEKTVPNMNKQTRQELQTRQLYTYMGLHENMHKIRQKFSKVFLPFGCKKDLELPRLQFNYRRFSEQDLHKKAIPPPKQKKKKSLIVLKANEKYQPSPFDQQKSVVVSWSILRSKSSQNMESIKFSSNKVKKYIRQDPQDKLYLKEYKQPKLVPRYMIEKKITQIHQIEERDKKPHKVIENLQRMEEKILSAKLKLQKKLNTKI